MTAGATGPDIEGLTYLNHLGSGGYSDVFLYQRNSPRMRVAVKVLKDGRLSDAERSQFEVEAETMAELADHPNIVQVFSTGVLDDGRPYLVMKYFPPPNLAERAAVDRFSVADVLRTGVKIASAVETAHRAGILHRDIKPANILVSQYGEPALTDFGIAGRAVDSDDADDVGVSIPWAPPEVLTGESNGSPQSDVYSLAATIWNLVAGRSPFEVPGGDNGQAALMTRVLRTQAPSTGRADVPASLERLLSQALSKSPAVRQRSALDLARGLQAVEQEERFLRTEIVVEGLGSAFVGGTTKAGDSTQSGDHTRMRAPVRPADPRAPKAASRFATPNQVPPPVQSPVAPLSEPSTVARPARPSTPTSAPQFAESSRPAAPVEPSTVSRFSEPSAARTPLPDGVAGSDATMRRATSPAAAPAEVAPERHRSGRPWALALAAAVVVVAVVVGVVLSSRSSPNKGNDVGTSRSPSAQLDQPPGTPTVSRTYDAARGTLTFSWTYTGRQAGDYFVVASAVGAHPTQVDVPHYSVRTRTPHSVCLVVAAYHAGTSIGSQDSPQLCGP